MEVGGATRVYALLGDPVAHSLSPVMQNAGFRALGIDAVYVPFRCEESAVAPLMEALARQGGGGNVTVPYKTVAAKAVGGNGSLAAVCNTFWGTDGKLEGADTDSGAIMQAMSGLEAAGGSWLLIGTGGSARAALRAASRAGARVAVRSRDPQRAEQFLALARSLDVEPARPEDCTAIINCTPLGLKDQDPPPHSSILTPKAQAALDLIYRPNETPWIRAMRAAGLKAADGREVLLEQGAAAFECWFPGRSAPREVMRAALHAALG